MGARTVLATVPDKSSKFWKKVGFKKAKIFCHQVSAQFFTLRLNNSGSKRTCISVVV